MEQSINIWLSFFANGGMIYSNTKDCLTKAIEKRNDELSKKLVQILREKLNNHFVPGFDEIDVKYDKILVPKITIMVTTIWSSMLKKKRSFSL